MVHVGPHGSDHGLRVYLRAVRPGARGGPPGAGAGKVAPARRADAHTDGRRLYQKNVGRAAGGVMMAALTLDDGFADHPKIAQVGAFGAWLQVQALCYAHRNSTGGFLPQDVADGFVRRSAPPDRGVDWPR